MNAWIIGCDRFASTFDDDFRFVNFFGVVSVTQI